LSDDQFFPSGKLKGGAKEIDYNEHEREFVRINNDFNGYILKIREEYNDGIDPY